MNYTLTNIIIFASGATFTVLALWFFVQVPYNNWLYTNTEAVFNSSNTCTELVFLNSNLNQNLSYDDYLHFQNLIKQKSEKLKCP